MPLPLAILMGLSTTWALPLTIIMATFKEDALPLAISNALLYCLAFALPLV
jgi:hypothetical protein